MHPVFLCVDKLINTLGASKREGEFAEHEFVGVCVYGRVYVRQKQAKNLEILGFQGFSNVV